ncbi:hypothetical protein [Kocuria rosea]|uniref:Uncharacterized protein n=1 Tax=Kocuria rosea TaxID=1275 RepID=A0A4R5YD84_KOCRO|nr:hypothetical protein [Kocuria rosea]TDL43010.1 hypothetical protein E2R59_09320 [Kocuria rosea]
MRWQYWAALVVAGCMVVLALESDRAWPLALAAAFALFVLRTQSQRDRGSQQPVGRQDRPG